VSRAAATGRALGLTHALPQEVSIETVLAALADPVRLEIVRQLASVADWERACGTFDLPVGKATRSHHFAVLRQAGLIEQRDVGARRLNRLRRPEIESRFPGLLRLVVVG
jgi:DNA-binding transcriptional ArsR family regulator